MNYKIVKISSEIAQVLCRKITVDLPEYFGLPDSNETYSLGVGSRINFAAITGEHCVGLLSIDFPYPEKKLQYLLDGSFTCISRPRYRVFVNSRSDTLCKTTRCYFYDR